MKKIIYLFMLFSVFLSFSQEEKKYSFDFKNTNLKIAVDEVEKNTSFHFFYDIDWFTESIILINATVNNATLPEVLKAIFEKTDLNFFISENNIIITKNTVIYDKLPVDYFDKKIIPEQINQSVIVEGPILYRDSNENVEKNQKESATLIGKETLNSKKNKFILSGTIKDSRTGETVSNITIKIKNSKINTVTNNQGYYSFEIPSGTNYVEVVSLNHKKSIKKVVLFNDGILNIAIDEKVNLLDEVVLKAKKNERIRSAISGVTSIDIEGIKNIPLVMGERDIFRVAAALPGIKTVGEGSAGYNVRGGKEDQNLILLDNALIYNPAHFFGFFSAVNPFTTKKATVYKGSIPAEFGGRLSSVFDITTKNGDVDTFKGEAGIGPVTSNIAISTPIVKGKSSLLFGGRGTYSGWILRSLKQPRIQNSEASFFDVIAKYNHKFNSNNNFETTFYYSKDVFKISSDSLIKYSNSAISLKYEHTFNSKSKGAIQFTNSQYKYNVDYDNGRINSFEFGFNINETQGIIKMNYLFNPKHKFTYGISSKLYKVNPGFLNPKNNASTLLPVSLEEQKGLESAFFVSDNFKVSDKLLFDFGLRYSIFNSLGASNQKIYQSDVPLNSGTVIETKTFGNNEVFKTYTGFEPRISARYFLTDDFSVKASYDRTYQYIHLLSSNTTQSPTDTWKLSDINTKPQDAQQFSLGFFKNFNKYDLELSIESYYKTMNNFLDYKVGAQLNLAQNIETQLLQGQGKAYGVEVLLKKEEGRLNGWIGYTYSRTLVKLDSKFNDEKINGGDYFPSNFDKPHDVSIVANYKFTKRYSVSANFVYQTGRPITYPIGAFNLGNAQYTLYSDRNKFRIPDYYRLDIGVNVEGNHKIKKLAHSFWNFSIYNVLGINNPYAIYFVTDSGQIKAYKTSIFAVPIPTITYNFKF